MKAPGYHYTAHQFNGGHRHSSNLIEGFNLAILDVDGDVSIDTARELLKDYKAIFATTKRHTPKAHRFRIIFPMSHVIKLDSKGYSRFMQNVHAWLPFAVDSNTTDCARKWESFNGDFYIQDGDLLDALDFIPNTYKEEAQKKQIKKNANLSSMERWFLLNTKVNHNRNQMILRYALALVDTGLAADKIHHKLIAFNNQLEYPIDKSEIDGTVMQTVLKRSNPKLAIVK